MKENLNQSFNLPRIITLMYHRIDTPDTDPWGICVSVDNFEEQVQFLRNNFNVISLGCLIEQLTTGNIINDSICLTFDDGYADNYINATPILEKYHCPATFFISTSFIGQAVPFWWDELEFIFLHSKNLPGELILHIDEKTFSYTLNTNELGEDGIRQHANWKWHEPPPTDRCNVFLQIWETLRPLLNNDIARHMAAIRQWADVKDHRINTRIPMSEHQLRELSQNPLFTIAIHTHSHIDLDRKEKKDQIEEILSCKNSLGTKYGIESNCLAYPYGRYNADTIEVARSLGIDICFTTRPEVINADSDKSLLGRYQVFNGNSESLKHQLDLI